MRGHESASYVASAMVKAGKFKFRDHCRNCGRTSESINGCPSGHTGGRRPHIANEVEMSKRYTYMEHRAIMLANQTEAEGREVERQAIVKWLRKKADEIRQLAQVDYRSVCIVIEQLEQSADAIERGEHLEDDEDRLCESCEEGNFIIVKED